MSIGIFAFILSSYITISSLLLYNVYIFWFGRKVADFVHEKAKASTNLNNSISKRKIKSSLQAILLPDVFNDDISRFHYYWECLFKKYHLYLGCFYEEITSSLLRNQLFRIRNILRLNFHFWSITVLAVLIVLYLYDTALSRDNCEKDRSAGECERNPLDVPTDLSFRKFASCQWTSEKDLCEHVPVMENDYVLSHLLMVSFLVLMLALVLQSVLDSLTSEIIAYLEASAMKTSNSIVPTNTITADKSTNLKSVSRASDVEAAKFMNTSSYSNAFFSGTVSVRDKHLQLVDWDALEEFGDEYRLLQSPRGTMLRAVRCYQLRKRLDYVPVSDELSFLLSVPRSFKWPAKPECFDGDSNCLNRLKFSYQLLKFQHYASSNPAEARKLLSHCRVQRVDIVVQQLQRARRRADEVRALLIGCCATDDGSVVTTHSSAEEIGLLRHAPLQHSHTREALLLKVFVADWFNGVKQALAGQLLLEAQVTQTLARNRALKNLSTHRAALAVCMLLVAAVAGFTLHLSLQVSDEGAGLWAMAVLLSHLLYAGAVQPVRLLIVETALPVIFLRRHFLRLLHTMQARWKYVLQRDRQLAAPASRVFGLIQHFHPACRVARHFPYLSTARVLLSLHDEDLPQPAFFPDHSDRRRRRKRKNRRRPGAEEVEKQVKLYAAKVQRMFGSDRPAPVNEDDLVAAARRTKKIAVLSSLDGDGREEKDLEAGTAVCSKNAHINASHAAYTLRKERRKPKVIASSKPAMELQATNVINNDLASTERAMLFEAVKEAGAGKDEYRPEYKIEAAEGRGSPLLRDCLLIVAENWRVRCVYAFHRARHYSSDALALVAQLVFLLPSVGLRHLVFEVLVAALLFALLFIAAAPSQ